VPAFELEDLLFDLEATELCWAARRVVEHWGEGNLAGAVNELDLLSRRSFGTEGEEELRSVARSVVDTWDHGDLACAVSTLDFISSELLATA
jgi:hypothetical protein